MTVGIRRAETGDDILAVRQLFQEYAASLDIDLAFQNFVAELASLPGSYAGPTGALFLAADPGRSPMGCVGVRPLATAGHCEMKRLYVHPSARGSGLGSALAKQAIRFAQAAGYSRILLDTLPTMTGAQALYRSLGFQPVSAYNDNPVAGVMHFQLKFAPPLAAEEFL